MMARRWALTGLVACCLVAASCGSHQPSPSVALKLAAHLTFAHSEVYVFDLVPTASPSGIVALKSVHDGRATTLGSLRFRDMRRAGSVAVQCTSRTLEAAFAANGIQSHGGLAVFPANTVAGGTAWTASGVADAPDAGPGWQESDFWVVGRWSPQQTTGGQLVGDFSGVVADSRTTPADTSYCLTISIDRS
jgi:hypothetical protein